MVVAVAAVVDVAVVVYQQSIEVEVVSVLQDNSSHLVIGVAEILESSWRIQTL